MKKFLSLLAAGSLALSLTAMTVSAAMAAETTVINLRTCKEKEGRAKIQCLRDAQRTKLQQHTQRKLGRIEERMKKRLETYSRHGIKVERKSPRLLESDRNALTKKRALRLRSILKNTSSSSSSSTSSSTSSAQ